MTNPIEIKTEPSASQTIQMDGTLRDRALMELKTTRNLQKAVNSVERFLFNQIDRIEVAFKECQQIEEQGRIVQQKWVELEEEKQAWLQRREQEMSEINETKRKLAQGLRALERK